MNRVNLSLCWWIHLAALFVTSGAVAPVSVEVTSGGLQKIVRLEEKRIVESPPERTPILKIHPEGLLLDASDDNTEVVRLSNIVNPTSNTQPRYITVNVTGTREGGLNFVSVLPDWAAAVISSVVASGLMVWGFALQKRAAGFDLHAPASMRMGDMVLSTGWLLGLVLIILSLVGDYVAYSLAPLSLTTPLGGITVVLNNMVLAPCLLGERLQPWPDAFGSLLVVTGSLLTTAAGAHHAQALTTSGLLESMCRPVCIIHIFLLLVSLLFCAGYLSRNKVEMQDHTRAFPLVPNLRHVAVVAFSAAGAGGIANLALKAGIELLKLPTVADDGATAAVKTALSTWRVTSYGSCFLVAAIAAVAQLNYVNKGLRLYQQTVFVPIHVALLVVMNTFLGAIIYQEYGEIFQRGLRGGIFSIGMCLIIQGICTFTLRKPDFPAAAGASADPGNRKW